MSISVFGESSKSVLQQADLEENSVKQQDSLLADAFDDQIKLVEKFLAQSKGNPVSAQKKKNTSKKPDISKEQTNTTTTNKTSTAEKSHKPLEYTNRSRIYRYEADDADDTLPPKTANKNSLIHPPADFHFDPSNDTFSHSDPRAKMLMSWYMAGYHTGYYDAIRKYKRDLE